MENVEYHYLTDTVIVALHHTKLFSSIDVFLVCSQSLEFLDLFNSFLFIFSMISFLQNDSLANIFSSFFISVECPLNPSLGINSVLSWCECSRSQLTLNPSFLMNLSLVIFSAFGSCLSAIDVDGTLNLEQLSLELLLLILLQQSCDLSMCDCALVSFYLLLLNHAIRFPASKNIFDRGQNLFFTMNTIVSIFSLLLVIDSFQQFLTLSPFSDS